MASATPTCKTTFCVTGATGFVASSLVKLLLQRGHTVHATVRDPGNVAKVRHLLDIPGAGERLKIFSADLLEEGSFDAAIDGCDGVFHVASPVNFNPNDPERDVMKPAINGTLNVLKACSKAKAVKRVVVTSSACTASINESEEQNQCIDETCWTDVDFLCDKKPIAWAYPVSKTLAERAALQYGEEQGLDVVTINPVLVAGSAINPNVPQTVEVVLSLLTRTPRDMEAFKVIQMVYGFASLVHVDDVCSAQIFLMDNPSAVGRYIHPNPADEQKKRRNMLRRKPTLVEVRLEDKEELKDARDRAAAAATQFPAAPPHSAGSNLGAAATLLAQFDSKPSVHSRIGFSNNNNN